MKKIITFILFTSILLHISPLYAAGDCSNTCKIENTPEVLIKIIWELRKINRNIDAEVWKLETKKTSLSSINASMMKSYNTITNWGWFFSSFEYSVVFPITNSVPDVIKRDQKFIEKEISTLKKSLDKVYKKGLGNEEIGNVCTGIDTTYIDCEWKSWKASKLIEGLTQDIYTLDDFYKSSIVWTDTKKSIQWNYLKESAFTELGKYYNSNTAESCSKCEWSFTEKVNTAMDKISEIQKGTNKWIQEWIDAWNLLIGGKNSNVREREKELLRSHLAKEWISSNAADEVMKNLENFNSTWATGWNWFFSTNNNFVTNSYKRLSENISEQYNNFSSSIWRTLERQKARESKIRAWDKWEIVINELKQTEEESTITKNLKAEFTTLYSTQEAFIGQTDQKVWEIEWKITSLHDRLTFTIKALMDICPISEKVCNDQMNWLWECTCK